MEQAQRLARILVQSARQIAEAMPRLRGFKDLSHQTVELNRLENDGDRVTREAIAELFRGTPDALRVIRWKDIYDKLEATVDRCEQAANIIESVIIKHA